MRILAYRSSALLAAILVPGLSLADTLSIKVTGLATSEGRLMVQVVHGEAQFAGDQASVAQFDLAARSGAMTLSVDTLPQGVYAVRVMHDLDADGELDRNLVGAPVEPWGFSNNARGNFGPPKWSAAKFAIQGDTQQTIQLRQ